MNALADKIPPVKLKPPYYRIEDPNSERAIRFVSVAVRKNESPKIRAGLAPFKNASKFGNREDAQTYYDVHCTGEVLDIVRVDA